MLVCNFKSRHLPSDLESGHFGATVRAVTRIGIVDLCATDWASLEHSTAVIDAVMLIRRGVNRARTTWAEAVIRALVFLRIGLKYVHQV